VDQCRRCGNETSGVIVHCNVQKRVELILARIGAYAQEVMVNENVFAFRTGDRHSISTLGNSSVPTATPLPLRIVPLRALWRVSGKHAYSCGSNFGCRHTDII
jgi:hypothetical protein